MSERRRLCISKRASIALMLFVVAGAIVNVAVAWAIYVTGSVDIVEHGGSISFAPSDPTYWQTAVISRSGMIVIDAEAWKCGPTPPSQEQVPTWSATRTPPMNWSNYNQRDAFREVAYGWPSVCLYSRVSSKRNGMFWPTDNPSPRSVLWPGFAINTAFYAFILWLLFALGGTPFALRRRRRIKRGLCPKCAYPVGTNEVCTECGKPVNRGAA